jgi:hypothetical protein
MQQSPHIIKHHPNYCHQSRQPQYSYLLSTCHHQTYSAPKRHSSKGEGCARTEGASNYCHAFARYKGVALNRQQQPSLCSCSFISTEHNNFYQCDFPSLLTCNNNPFASLADKEPKDSADHASFNCSPNNVTITTSNQAPARAHLPAQPITHGIVLTPCPASTHPPQLTVTPRIFCSLREEQKRKTVSLRAIIYRERSKLGETEGVVKRSLSNDIIKGTDRPIPPSTED